MSIARRQLRFCASLTTLALVAGLLFLGPGASSASVSADKPAQSSKFAHDIARLAPGDPYRAFVHFEGGSTAAQRDFLASRGVTVTSAFPAVEVVYATGTVADFRALTDESSITYLEADRKLDYYGDTATWATRARVAQEAVAGGPYRDAEGRVVDGTGIGVAIVDSGVSGEHPDLKNRMAKNYKIVCSTPGLINTTTQQCFGPLAFVEAPMTDTTSGHGTHVAGIVAGDGTASNGTYKGVATGSSLYGYSTGEGISVLYAAEAFQHIITNFDSFNPRIRVVNNSWGDVGGTAYDANSIWSKLTAQLVQKGVTMVYAAGNSGGTGSADQTSSTCKDPTPGVICVANYNDANRGTRTGSLSSGSSRGRAGQDATYPDISAPGTSITAACLKPLPLCAGGPTVSNLELPTTVWAPYYDNLSGTSMAAPHLAGVAALLYQARPGITPAEVEDVLQDTAVKFTAGAAYAPDPQNPNGTHSVDKGAGLANVPAALDAVGAVKTGGPDAIAPHTVVADPPADGRGFGAGEIIDLSSLEVASGLRYTITVRDADDVGPGGLGLLRLYQNVNGLSFVTTIEVRVADVRAAAQNATTNNAVATNVVRDLAANKISFDLPFSVVGNPPAGSPVHNVRLLAYGGAGLLLALDAAPGGSAESADLRPEFGASFTVVRPGADPTPTPTPTTSSTPAPTPTPTPSLTPAPTPTPTPTPSSGGGSGVTYYFHSDSGLNNQDQVLGPAPSFDTSFPVFDEYSAAYDVPTHQSTAPTGAVDPIWHGNLGTTATSLSVDLWQQTQPAQALGSAYFNVRVFRAGTYFDLYPLIAREDLPVGQVGVARLQHTFTKMRAAGSTEEDPTQMPALSLPAGDVSIAVRGYYIDSDAFTEIRFDSKTYPSGFSVNGGGSGPTASPTPTPSSTPTTDPTEGPGGFTAEGHIAFANIFGFSTTEAEWLVTCPDLPSQQGDDAYIFTLPNGFDATGETTTASGQSASDYDLDLVFYGNDCLPTGSAATTDADESATTPADTRYVLVTAFEGSDIDVTLTVGSGGEASPTPTATPTATASPTTAPTSTPTPAPSPSGGGRGSYPVTPNDPYFGVNPTGPTDFRPTQWGLRKVLAPQAWAKATGFGIRVAVIDSGVDLQHEDLQCPGKLEVAPNSDKVANDSNPDDENSHGTHVAGIIGACTNNGKGVAGVAPDATIVPIRVLDAAGSGNDAQLTAGINRARELGVHVINMSLGYPPGKQIINNVAQINTAIEAARNAGIVLVAAAGNDSSPLCDYPALAEDIICVAATDPRDLKAAYSTFPNKTDAQTTIGPGLVAPGGSGAPFCDTYAENVLSTIPLEKDTNGCTDVQGYANNFGSSMASPHVAGVAALVYDRLGGATSAANARKVIDTIITSTRDLGTPGYDPVFGYGLVNAHAAVDAITGPEPTPTPTTDPTEGPGGFTDEGHIAFANLFGVSTTEAEWLVTCPDLPSQQGDDAYIFTLPNGFDATGKTTTASGQSASDYDLDLVFYGNDCLPTGSAATTDADESATTPADTRYVLVTAFEGSDIDVTLTVGSGGGGTSPSPTASATASPTATPTEDPDPDGRGTYPLTPDDDLFGDQWGMVKIQAPQAWQEKNATGHGITIAVVDSGLDLGHPDFDCDKLNVLPRSNIGVSGANGDLPQDADGHGTHVAGIAAACTDNGEGVVGVAPDATVMPVRVFGVADIDQAMARGIRFATQNGAHVINLSIGDIPPFSHFGPDGYPETEEALEEARTGGVVIAAAAGNFDQPTCEYPSLSRNVICVVATDRDDLRAYYTDFPVNVDRNADELALEPVVAAPGGQGTFCEEAIASTYLRTEESICYDPGYEGLDGTSMSSPHVAGVAALVYDRLGGVRSAANADRVVQAILDGADDLYTPGWDPIVGYGRLNALEAVKAIPLTEPTESPTSTPTPTPTPTETVGPEATTVSFTDNTPTSGQFSDDVLFEAALVDSDGDPIAGAELAFELTGESDPPRTWTATTGEDGIAGELIRLNERPGSYVATVRFTGDDETYTSSADVITSFEVTKEDVDLSLVVDGYGANRTLTATLTDRDDPDSGLAGQHVEFAADGQTIGGDSTDENGVATFSPPAPYDKGRHLFEATSPGDEYYLSSSDQAETGEGATELSFTDRTDTRGQHSDTVRIEVLLVDEAGDPIAGEPIDYELSGPGGSRTFTDTTGDDGIATRTITLTEQSGDHELVARYGGRTGDYSSSFDTTTLIVDKEDALMTLTVAGNRTARAKLVDSDSPSDGIGGRTVEFFDGGMSLGSAETNSDGVATIDLVPGTSGKRSLEAVFAGDSYFLEASDRYTLMAYALLAGGDLEVGGNGTAIRATDPAADIHSNRNLKIGGKNGHVCGNISAVGTVEHKGTQCAGYTTRSGAAPVTLPNMADHAPGTAAATHVLNGDRKLNGYSCALPGGCIVWVKGKLEIAGNITGNVWFLTDKETIITGNLKPANNASSVKIHSKSNVEITQGKAQVEGLFLAGKELKLGGSEQVLTGLFWGTETVDMGGSKSQLIGAVISNGILKIGGSNLTITYNPNVLGLN